MSADATRRCTTCGALVRGTPCPACGADRAPPRVPRRAARQLLGQEAAGPAYLAAPPRPFRGAPTLLACATLVLAVGFAIAARRPDDPASARGPAPPLTAGQARLSALHADLVRLGAAYPPRDPAAWSEAVRQVLSDRALQVPAGRADTRVAAVELRAAALRLAGLAAAPPSIARDPARIARMRHALHDAHPARPRTPEVPIHAP